MRCAGLTMPGAARRGERREGPGAGSPARFARRGFRPTVQAHDLAHCRLASRASRTPPVAGCNRHLGQPARRTRVRASAAVDRTGCVGAAEEFFTHRRFVRFGGCLGHDFAPLRTVHSTEARQWEKARVDLHGRALCACRATLSPYRGPASHPRLLPVASLNPSQKGAFYPTLPNRGTYTSRHGCRYRLQRRKH